MVEPHTDHPDSDPDRVRMDLLELAKLTAAGIELDGETQIAESTWVIYGHISYDGEVIVGEYHSASEAAAVLRATERHGPEDDRPVP